MKLEGNKLPKVKAKATWERRLAMVSSNNAEEEQEAFVISKYDLLPESLTDRVQVSRSHSHSLHVVGFWRNRNYWREESSSTRRGNCRSYSIGCSRVYLTCNHRPANEPRSLARHYNERPCHAQGES